MMSVLKFKKVQKKDIIIFLLFVIFVFALLCFNWCKDFKKTIKIEKVAQCIYESPTGHNPWTATASKEIINNHENYYGVDLPDVDLEQYMFIISYDAELEKFQHSLFKKNPGGLYYGYPVYGEEKPNIITYYVAPKVLVGSNEVFSFE